MKLHLTQAENSNLITGYGDGFVEVNKHRHTEPLIVTPEEMVLNWQVSNFEHLSEVDFTDLVRLNPEVILLGTGNIHRFAHPKLTATLMESGISVECMTTQAACRTYNILMSEGRNVAAALILA